MPTTLTGNRIKDTYPQILHVDGGVTAAETVVRGGNGTATALKVGTTSISVDNVKLDGNTVSTTNTNGDLILSPDGTGSVAIARAAITGGTVSGITDLAVADGGTGASTAADARTNLGLGSMAVQNAGSVAVSGGSVRATTALGFADTASTGGAVTQATDKSTGVTLDKPCGAITMNGASLGAGVSVSFTLTNSAIAANDVVMVSIASAATTNTYFAGVDAVATGSCRIHVRNVSASPQSEALVLNFVVIKAINA